MDKWIPIIPFGGFLGGNIIGLIVLISRPTRPPAKLTFYGWVFDCWAVSLAETKIGHRHISR